MLHDRAFPTALLAIVTNSVHAVVLALASASIGAIFSSTATDMGTQVRGSGTGLILLLCSSKCLLLQGILDRYQQIQPKVIFSEIEVTWLGKAIDLIPKYPYNKERRPPFFTHSVRSARGHDERTL